jgi:hypothetical protein
MSDHATGPRSDEGKQRSSLNAIKHGLRSQRPVLPTEDPDEWDAFRSGVVAELHPMGVLEHELADRAALQLWRLRRAARYEAQVTADAYGPVRPAAADAACQPEDDPSDRALVGAFARADKLKQAEARQHDGELLQAAALDRVVRYEAHVSRQLRQALNLLRQLQAERRARETQAPGPAAVCVPWGEVFQAERQARETQAPRREPQAPTQPAEVTRSSFGNPAAAASAVPPGGGRNRLHGDTAAAPAAGAEFVRQASVAHRNGVVPDGSLPETS